MTSSALSHLVELKLKAKHQKNPSFPYPVKPRYSDKDANGLTSCIIDFIDLSGGWATRINSMGRYLTDKQKYIPGSTKKGTADIHAVYKGVHLSIEVKIGKDKQSEEQKHIQEEITKAGGFYFIAVSFQQFYDWFNSTFTASSVAS